MVDARTQVRVEGVRIGLFDVFELESERKPVVDELGGGWFRVGLTERLNPSALLVTSPVHQTIALGELPLARGAIHELGTVELEPVPAVEILVLTSSSAPIEGADVRVAPTSWTYYCANELERGDWPERLDLSLGWQGETDAEGRACVPVSSREPHRVTVEHSSMVPEWRVLEMKGDAPITLEFRLSAGGALVVLALDYNTKVALTGIDVVCECRAEDGTWQRWGTARTDVEGRARFDGLPTGQVRFASAGEGDPWQELEIVEGGTTERVLWLVAR